jgi:hypothetical protein
MDQLVSKNQITREEAHENSKKVCFDEYKQAIQDTCKECMAKATCHNNLIWVDKNFLPVKLLQANLMFRQSLNKNFCPVFLYMVPETKTQDIKGYPFSSEYLLTRFAMGTKRVDDGSLPLENPGKVYRIMREFLLKHYNVKFDDKFLETYLLDGYLRTPMAFKHNLEINQEKVKILHDVMESYNKPLPKQDMILKNLISAVFKEGDELAELQNPEQEAEAVVRTLNEWIDVDLSIFENEEEHKE